MSLKAKYVLPRQRASRTREAHLRWRFAQEEQQMLDFFARYMTKRPDGSWFMSIFKAGYRKALRDSKRKAAA